MAIVHHLEDIGRESDEKRISRVSLDLKKAHVSRRLEARSNVLDGTKTSGKSPELAEFPGPARAQPQPASHKAVTVGAHSGPYI